MKLFGLLVALILILNPMFARDTDGKRDIKDFMKVGQLNPAQTVVNINNITTWVRGDGFHDWVVEGSFNGTFPKGTAGFIFSEAVVVGGKVDDGQTPVVRVNGSVYSSGFRSGIIRPDRTRGPELRPYRVRPDWATADLTEDAADFFQKPASQVTQAEIDQIREQYRIDWQEWPASLGAPFDDRNRNGIYEPNIDIPGVPGASMTLWIVYNDLDAGRTSSTYGSPPIGLEIQETYWAYAFANPLGNVIFKRARIIYKGTPTTKAGAVIDSMYIVQWSDPDLGQYTDDFVGCDTVLNLGYVYNSSSVDAIYFNRYGLAPPAGGYDFLQGAVIRTGNPNDSAIVDFKWRRGYKYISPKPMSVFTFFAAGSPRSDPTRGGAYTGTLQWYNLMAGFEPRPEYPARIPIRDHLGNVTKYELAGDPVTGTGDIDGRPTPQNPNRFPPGDRRMVMSTGPFTMALGDTQEIVIALVGGLGADYKSSITILKYNDIFAQYAYDNLFELPSPPPAPKVTAVPLDGRIILNWGDDIEAIRNTEEVVRKGFRFEGYNVYQFPSETARLEDAVKIATYDVVNDITVIVDRAIDEKTGVIVTKPVQAGRNTGIKRYIVIDRDYVRNTRLANGTTYYFAVTAYSYTDDPNAPFRALESKPVIIAVTPQSPKPGVTLGAFAGDTLKVTYRSRIPGRVSDGKVYPIVVDPMALTGNTYRVTFDTVGGKVVWNLIDVTANRVKLSRQTNQSGDDSYYIVDGIMVKVLDAPPRMKTDDEGGWRVVSGTLKLTWERGDGLHFENFGGAIGYANPGTIFGTYRNPITPDRLKNIRIVFAPTDVNGNFDPNHPNASFAYRYLRRATAAIPPAANVPPPFVVDGTKFINRTAGYPYQDFVKVPLTVYDIESTPPRKLAIGFLENNANPAPDGKVYGLVDGRYWPAPHDVLASVGRDNVEIYGPREWLFIFDTTYTETPVAALMRDILNVPLPTMYTATWNRRGNVAFSADDVIEFYTNHINFVTDEFTFTAPKPQESVEQAKLDVEKINAFPNPYYGFNSRERVREEKFITFSHLPKRATIRIFTLSGVLVRTIIKDDDTQFARWNLRNDNNLPVASGVYVVHIDMPDLGKSKVLKVAIIQEQQILRVY